MLISAHGNSLRALVKYLDKVGDNEIVDLNIPTGELDLIISVSGAHATYIHLSTFSSWRTKNMTALLLQRLL